MQKIDFELSGVPQTLLLPLIGRAMCSKEPDSLLRDERAVQLVESLNYDFDKLYKQIGHTTLFWMARAYHFDQAIKAFLKTHPKAVVVNLGAGLETAFYRVDNGQLQWVDIDLPEVIHLRQQLIPSEKRVHLINKSALDYSWMDEVREFGRDVFFFAGGFFMYFPEEQVKALFLEMAKRFSNAELIFDCISTKALSYGNDMLKETMKNATMKWSLDDPKILEQWSPGIKVVNAFSCFKDVNLTSSLFARDKVFLYDWVNNGDIIQVKFC